MASRYWVGGSAAWDATAGTKWAATSGGAGGQTVPSATDDVFFNGSSGSGTVTLNTTVNCQSLTFTGFTGTFTHSSASGIININAAGGTLTLASGMTYNATVGTINFLSTTDNGGAGWPITTNGKSLPSINFNGSGGKWTLQDALTTQRIIMTIGELNSNNFNITVTSSNGFGGSGASAKVLTLGTSTLTTTAFSYGDSASAISGGTIIATRSFSSSSTTLNNVIFTNNASQGLVHIINGVFTCVNLTFDFATGSDRAATVFLGNGSTTNPTVTGTFTVNGTTGRRVFITSALPPAPQTITAANVSLSYAVFMDIVGAGAATWSGTELGDGLGNSGITFTPSQTNYWVGGAGTWSDSSHWASSSGGAGGTGRVPTVHDDVVLDENSGSGTVSLDNWGIGRNVDMGDSTVSVTAVSIPVQIDNAPIYGIWGSLTLPSGAAVFDSGPSTNSLSFINRSNATLTTNGKTLNLAGAAVVGMTNNTAPSRLTFTGDSTFGGNFITRGSAAVDNSGNHNVDASGWFLTAAGTTTNQNNWGNGTYIFRSSTNIGLSGGSTTTEASSPTLRYVSSGTTTLSVGAAMYPNIIVENGTLTGSTSVPLKSLTIKGGATLRLLNSSVNTAVLNCPGTTLSSPSIISTSNGVARTLTVTTSANVRYTSIRDNTAAGAASPLTAYNSTNVSNNTNWNFVTTSFAPPSSFFEVL